MEPVVVVLVDDDYTLWVTEEDGIKTEIKFAPNLIKYFEFFKGVYEEGYKFGEELEQFHLDGTYWHFIHDVYEEHDGLYGDSHGPTTPIGKTSVTGMVENIALPDLYRMMRILDYYISPLMILFIVEVLVKRLFIIPLDRLAITHPKVRLPSMKEELAKTETTFSSVLYKKQAIRGRMVRAILGRYLGTQDLIKTVYKFLPKQSVALSSGNGFVFVATYRGLYSWGDDYFGQRGLTFDQLQRQTIQNELVRIATRRASINQQLNMLTTIPSYTMTDYKRVHGAQFTLQNELSVLVSEETRIKSQFQPLHMGGQEPISVSCGAHFTMILTNGGLFACGANAVGELGQGHTNPLSQGVYKVPLDNVVAVWCNNTNQTIAETPHGLYVWGKGHVGTHPDLVERPPVINQPTLFYKPDKVVRDVVCSEIAALVLFEDGSVSAFFRNGISELEGKYTQICGSSTHTLLLSTEGSVYSYVGKIVNAHGELGTDAFADDNSTNYRLILLFRNLINSKVDRVKAGEKCSFFRVAGTNRWFACGDNITYKLGVNWPYSIRQPLEIFTHETILDIASVESVTFFLTCSGLHWAGLMNTSATLNLQQVHGLVLAEGPICPPQPIIIDDDSNKKARVGCHLCGVTDYTKLSLHRPSQRAFCTDLCLSKYNKFTV